MAEHVLSVDLGGTTMRAVVAGADGAVRRRRWQPTPRPNTCPDALLALVGEACFGAGRGAADAADSWGHAMSVETPLQRIVLVSHRDRAHLDRV